MNNPTRHRCRILGIRGRGSWIAFAILLGVAILTAPSAQAQTYTESVLHSFTGAIADGQGPGGLVMDSQGTLYGTTAEGGGNYVGTVFQVDSAGYESVLYNFLGDDGEGAYPTSGLVMDTQGNLYGTTSAGGDSSCLPGSRTCGTVYLVNIHGEGYTLYTFQNARLNGAIPAAGLVMDAEDNFYGTTLRGGDRSAGTVFKLDTSGNESVLHNFGLPGDGVHPQASLLLDPYGNVYGTTTDGGTQKEGTVFKLDASGSETVLYSFTGLPGDGSHPRAGLVMDAQGNLYGTTANGGTDNRGTVFKLDASGDETVLYSFTGKKGDGAHPQASLLLDAYGNLYGTTTNGGGVFSCGGGVLGHGCGTVFELDAAGNETVLYVFTGSEPYGDGANPEAGLLQDAAGNLYGTTLRGGTEGRGTVFKLTLN